MTNLFTNLSNWKVKYLCALLMLVCVGVGNIWGATKSFGPTDFNGQGNSDGGNITYTRTPITVSSSKGYGYSGGQTRIITGGTLVVSCTSGYTISAVALSFTSSNYQGGLSTSYTGLSTTSWTSPATTSTARISSITVTYATAASHTLSSAVSPASTGTVSLSATNVAEGSTATATATPNSGYFFSSWSISGTGASLSSTRSNPTTVTMGTANATVTATFVEKVCTDKGASSVTSTSGGNSYAYGPVSDFHNYSTRQILYTKSDLNLGANKKGIIKSIYFYYKHTSAMTAKTSVDIYMANTNLSSLSTEINEQVPYKEFTHVYSGSLNCTATDNWNEFVLDTPFEYNGIGNLVVLIDDNSNDYDNNSYTFYYHSATGAQIYTNNDNTNEDPSTTDWSTYTAVSYRPSTKFCIDAITDMVQSTVTWVAGSNPSFDSQTDYEGTALIDPGTPSADLYCPGGKAFVGWTATPIDGEGSKPADLFTSVSGKSIPVGGATYYAVFANSASSSKTYQFDITTSDFTTASYGANNTTKTTTATATDASGATIDVDWYSYQIYQNSGTQWQKNTGYIYNKTDLGTVNSVTITKTAGGFNTWYGTTEHPTSGSQGSGKGFFTVKENNTATGKTSQVRVNFTKTVATYSNYATSCCTSLGQINGSFNLSQSNGVLTATLPSASKNANATSYRFTLYNNSDEEITHTDVATGLSDVSTTFSSPNVTAGNTYKVSVTPLVSPQGSYCSTTGTESDKSSITMDYTVTLAVNNAEYGSISPSSTLYVASGTSISASTNTLSVGATNITATYTPQTAQYTYGFTNWTWSPSGATITANTTATANFSRSTRTYNVTTTGITHASASPDIPATVAYGGSISTTITADDGYHLPAEITVSGASSTWDSSTGELTISSVTGDVTITITGEENGCSSYSFHSGGSDVWNTRAENKCFANVSGTLWSVDYTIASYTHYCVNYQGGKYSTGGSNNVSFTTAAWADMKFWGRSFAVGAATGAKGKLKIYSDSYDTNLGIGFEPDGYGITYGGTGHAFATTATANMWETDVVELPNVGSTTYTMGLATSTAGTYVTCSHSSAAENINVMGVSILKAGKKKILLVPGSFDAADAKYAVYDATNSAFDTDFMTDADGDGVWEGYVGSTCTTMVLCRMSSSATTADLSSKNWSAKWNQTGNITIGDLLNKYTITSLNGDDCAYTTTAIHPTTGMNGKFRMWDNSGDNNWYVHFVPHYILHYDANSGSGAPADQSVAIEASPCQITVSSTTPTRDGYTFLGWNESSSATTPDGNWDGGDTHAMTGDVTLYAVWAANHTLSYNYNGGDGSSCVGGTKYTGESFTACSSAGSKTGYTFNNWLGSNSTSYTAGSNYTMPDADLTLTAQWNPNHYDVTLNTNGGTINSGDVDEYTYGVGATLPTNVTRDGYRFDGWFDNSGCTGDAVTTISTTDFGDKTYYAKWTQVYTVTWYVNGDEWTSGTVTGNTQVPSGSKVSALPTAPTKSDCDDSKVFVGWKAAEIDGISVGNPGGIFTTQGTSPDITAKTDFYAVFADAGKAARTTLYDEPFKGTAGSNTDWASASSYFDDANTASITTTTSWKVSKYTTECSDNDGASGGSHMFCGSASQDIVFNFGNKSAYTDLVLTFNYRNNAAGGSPRSISCTISGDGGESWSDNIIDVASVTTQTWNAVSHNISNSNTSALKVKWTATAANPSRVDDIKLTGCLITYSNYVTSCSSCDADATFTNTTPAVSDIDCTSATLTATGGLATLGAAGCNISDYGFVIGTANNPAIGGDGVTKLQVGTTNPTLGEDFSYDATGLTKGTHYYIRAYAINRHGTAYSSSQNFWTKNVSSIAITTAPTKTNYIVGETFDATGMVVTATMASGSTDAVTGDVTYSESALTAGTSQSFTINYSLCETAVSTSQTINVYTLSVTEGTNPTYGTATNSSANIVSITGLGDHKTYTVTVTSSNATAVDNGDNTWSIINPTGNVSVRVDYDDAVQVKVYYKVDGVTVTGLTQDVYQSETTTLPTASELATAMSAQSMDIPDDMYPNFIGWSETEFSAQTAEPTIVSGTPVINAEKTYYAVYTNLNVRIIDTDNVITSSSYPASEQTKTVGSIDFKYHYILNGNYSGTHYLQFKSNSTEYGRIYNNTSMGNLIKLEAGYYSSESDVPVYACSEAGTITGSAISAESHDGSDPYVYTFPSNTSYFMVKGNNSTVYKPKWLKIYYCSSTVYYMTQFCTRYTITGASTSGTAVIVSGNTGGTLTSSANSLCEGKSLTLSAAVNAGYNFGGWTITGATSGDLTSLLDDATSLTPAAFTMPAENITVSATITEKEVTGWTWKQELADASEITIPATVDLYIGQQAKFNLKTYDPADVIAGKKGYNASYISADLAQDSKAGAYYVTRAKIAKESTTLTLTSTSNGSVQEVITIRIKALPLVHFVDKIHGETFDDVVANVDASEKRTVYTTKPTPTHSDVSDPGASYNTCEREHLHLVGWIESEWADAHPNAEPGDITGAGAGNYYAAGADIDLAAQNGKTFYAVWVKVE